MADAFVPRENCDVPVIPAIEGSLVAGCVVETPPDAECFAEAFRLLPPTFEFGCYAIVLEASFTGVALYDPISPSFIHTQITYNPETGFCQPSLELDFDAPCTVLSVNAASVEMNTGPFFNVGLTPNPTACQYDLDFDIGIPCPTFTNDIAVKFGHVTSATLSVIANDVSDACDFDFNLDLELTCPIFGFAGRRAQFGLGDGVLIFEYNPFVNDNFCSYNTSFDLTIPCAEFDTSFHIVLCYSCPLFAHLTIDRTTTGGICTHNTDLDISIPCPVLDVHPTVTLNQPLELGFNVTPDMASSSICAFDINFDLHIPCPSFDVSPFLQLNQPPSITFTFDDNSDDSNCAYEVGLTISIPCPSVEMSVQTFTFIANTGTPTFSITSENHDDTNHCDEKFKFDINIPCPTLWVGDYHINQGPSNSLTFSITSSNDSTGCRYKFDLGITIESGSTGVASWICALSLDSMGHVEGISYQHASYSGGLWEFVSDCVESS